MHFGGRFLLADIIQKQDLKELCSILVVLSREAAKILADQRSLIEGVENHLEISLALATEDRLESQKDFVAEKTRADNCSSVNQAVKSGPENSCTDVADMPKGRPKSLGTLALMCDEQDTTFTTAASINGIMNNGYSIVAPTTETAAVAYEETDKRRRRYRGDRQRPWGKEDEEK
ncbi:hypothetical protein J1N35_010396 [Gossypium stocksii]|uniref:Uncharacterized protein n=1 Tax=Gossypium stocksii TaxID=47602 RepID=A0A9D3W1R4_9ROSI|nr:hypothetical protein J1N35_010396 [Gossypium stocksii]